MSLRPEDLTKPNEAYRAIATYLKEAGVEDAGLDAQLLIRHVTKGLWFTLDKIEPRQARELAALAERRANREPLHYLLGSVDFMEIPLAVGPGVLIPRPETEELVLYAAKLLDGQNTPRILDLCAGSGAISLGLQKLCPKADITAVEWDQAALEYLKRNIAAYRKSHPVAPVAKCADVLTSGRLFPGSFYDLIVCNPPYVTEEEYDKLEAELRFEPKQALVAGEDPFIFYSVVAGDYQRSLKPGAPLVFEIGSGQGTRVRKTLKENGYNKIWVAKDLAGHSRICKGQRP